MDLLIDIKICKLINYNGVIENSFDSSTGGGLRHVPNFDTMNPWFEFVIPWLASDDIYYSIECTPLMGEYVVLRDENYVHLGMGIDKDPAMAFRKALTEYANREKI